ncbi:MAG: hypothetical protein ABIM46_07740, partial [candidate division WOR-3 bacterium]
VGISLAWLALGATFLYGFAPLDFYGDGAYFAQATIRWSEHGWPTTFLAGPQGGEFGWGFFTLWIYISILKLTFHLFGQSPGTMRFISLLSVGIALATAGLVMTKLRRNKGIFVGLFFFLMAISPMPLVIGHTERPEGLMTLWITASVVLILLPKSLFLRNLGFFILPIAFWIHQLGGLMAFCLFLVMTTVFLFRRKNSQQLLWLILGGAIVLAVSFLTAWYSGKLLIFSYVSGLSEKGWGFVKILSSWHLLLTVSTAALVFILWPLRKVKLDMEKDFIALITVGLVLIPMILGMRPRRTFQFVYPLVWILLYIGFLYAAQLGRVFKYGFLALVIAGMCFYWWRSRDIISITLKNPEYIRKTEEFVARNQASIAGADTVFMAFHGEGYLFWLLPKEKQLTASPYFRGPVREGNLVLITDYELRGIPYLVPLDSLDLGFTYSFYGARPFRRIYLCRGIGGN